MLRRRMLNKSNSYSKQPGHCTLAYVTMLLNWLWFLMEFILKNQDLRGQLLTFYKQIPEMDAINCVY